MMQLGTGQPGPLFMSVTASCQCCPTGPAVQGPHKRTGESLLCGEVHYGQDLSGLQDGSCANKGLGQSAAQEWLFCYELFRIS